MYPAQTATDWVTYGDAVVEVRPVQVTEVPPTKEEVDRGEGVIGRTVTLKVLATLWTSPANNHTLPEHLVWGEVGWAFKGDPSHRAEMAISGDPRVELGHTYVAAVVWVDARCSPGDEREPAGYQGLGAGGMIPADGGVLGVGEFEGSDQNLSQAEGAAQSAGVNETFANQMVGRQPSDITAVLETTSRERKRDFGPSPAPCT